MIDSGATATVTAEVSGVLHMVQAPEPLAEDLGVGWRGKTGQQIADPNGAKSNALSYYVRRACCWLEEIACVSNWTGGLRTREPQLVLAQGDSKPLCQLELVRSQERRVPWLSERRRLI